MMLIEVMRNRGARKRERGGGKEEGMIVRSLMPQANDPDSASCSVPFVGGSNP